MRGDPCKRDGMDPRSEGLAAAAGAGSIGTEAACATVAGGSSALKEPPRAVAGALPVPMEGVSTATGVLAALKVASSGADEA
jgi:hypothetical protein